MNDWFKKSYRRSLIDMHIHDWNPIFLSELDIDKYYEYLTTAKVDSAMIYLQSHVGLCYYPTALGKMHSAFVGREDMMRRLIDKCRASGISVVGYYSLIFNTAEEDRHPEWKMVADRVTGESTHDKGSRYGLCCPNNKEYREFLKAQIKELADYFTLDGIFFDMTYWPRICYCESCRKRFEAETGISRLPDMDNLKNENAMLFLRKRYEWMAEFAKWVTDYTRELMPNVTVSHNNANEVNGDWQMAVSEGVSDVSEYCTGDLYGDIYDHSFCMKYYRSATKNMPFEYMVSRFAVNLQQHTLSKTEERLTRDILLTLAHHGANFVIDAMDPVGTVNPRVAELIGKAYTAGMPYEKYTSEGSAVGDVAVWYSTTGRYNTEGQSFNNRTCAATLSKTLIKNHVPFEVMANTASGRLGAYKFVFAPAIAGLDDGHRRAIYDYIDNGGIFYFSGVEDTALMEELLGAELEGFSNTKKTYVSPVGGKEKTFFDFDEKYPLAMNDKHPILRGLADDAEVLAYLTLPFIDEKEPMHFASIHSNPPCGTPTDIPSVVTRGYGRGTVIWSALPIEGYDSYHHRQVTTCILREYLAENEQTICTNAPSRVELVAFSTDSSVLVSAVDLGDADERLKLSPFRISVAVSRMPRRVSLLPDERDVSFEYENGRVGFETRTLDTFDMYKIEL